MFFDQILKFPWNLIPRKIGTLEIREIKSLRKFLEKRPDPRNFQVYHKIRLIKNTVLETT